MYTLRTYFRISIPESGSDTIRVFKVEDFPSKEKLLMAIPPSRRVVCYGHVYSVLPL